MNLRILIINDDEIMQKLIRMRLEFTGYDVVCANTVEQVMQNTKLQKPDLTIIKDVMDHVDGFAVCKVLKSTLDTQHIPMVVLSSNRNIKDSFLDLGVNELIEFPFEGDVLMDRIQKTFLEQTLENATKQGPAGSARDPSGHAHSKRRILICEPSNDLETFMCDMLRKQGHYVETALSEEEIIKKVLTMSPHIILLNVQREKSSAKQIIEKIRRTPNIQFQVLLYTYFKKQHMAENSDLHYYYGHYLDQVSNQADFPIDYVGSLNKEIYKKIMEERMAQ